MRNAVKKLNVAGLRALIREEAAKARKHSRQLQENATGGLNPELAEAIESVAELVASELVSQGTATDEDVDEIRSGALGELSRIVSDIIDTWNETH